MKQVPPNSEVRITLRVPAGMVREMDEVMALRGISNASDFARQALRRMIDEERHDHRLEIARREQQIRETRSQYGSER